VPDAPEPLHRAAERIAGALAMPEDGPVAIDWPAELEVSERVDLAAIVRAMRATEARFAPLQLGPVMEGDGEWKATFQLRGPRGRIDLALALDPETGRLDAVSLVPVRQVAPDPG
jgi:hypothetical protein